MALLRIKLLGKPQLYLADQPLTGFTTAKTEALFYYLAATARPHARETLADLLWGEMPEEKARRSLAKALSDLRKVVAPYLVIDRQMAAIDLTADYELDMAHFQALVERGLAESERVDQRRVSLEEAAVLYEGEFLESFSLRQTLTFDAWLRAQREKLHELMLAGLDVLIDIYVHQADLDKSRGVDYAGRLLALDPQRESAHRQMMVLLAQTDQRTAALAQYETCRAILAKALGVEPTAEMSALYERLKETDAPLPHNLPKQSSLFVGREAELQQVAELLSLPDCHLLTIVGPGGIGKTRLALEAAMRYVRLGFQPDKTGFQDGIYFVDLTPILTGRVDPDRLANTLASTIAEALGISFHGPDDLLAQLLHYLRDKQMLLLLDNFDPLVEGAGMLAELIRQAPQTRLLVTSRERLNLLEEWVVEIQGLTYPGDKAEAELLTADPIDIEALLAYSAVALFGQLAEHIQHEFR
jgi:DNA-binding SARP family transcriptional activator